MEIVSLIYASLSLINGLISIVVFLYITVIVGYQVARVPLV